MTELRDARLRRALDEAPDAQLRPLPRTREAVLAAARAAAVTRPPWWRRFWTPSGGSRMPWNSALATVLVAGLVTVLWQGQEVPTAQPEAVTEAAKPAAGAPVPAKKETAEAAGPGVPPGAAVAERKRAASAAPARATQPVPAAPKVAAPAEPVREQRASPPAPAELAKQAERTEGQAAPMQDRLAPAPAAAAPARREAFMPQRWSQLRLEGVGKVVDVARGDAPQLAQDIERLAAAPDGTPFTEQVELRVRLLEDGRVAGTLVLGGARAGWMPDGAGPALGLPADPALVQGVRAEVERLLKQ